MGAALRGDGCFTDDGERQGQCAIAHQRGGFLGISQGIKAAASNLRLAGNLALDDTGELDARG